MDLVAFITELFSHHDLRAAFSEDPQGTLHNAGLDNVSPADIHDALALCAGEESGSGHHATSFAPPPPPPVHHDYATPAQSHEAAVQYLNSYITNTFVDDRDTTVDNSVHQSVDTHGGNFDQDLDIHSTTASGDGAVAVGGDVDHSPITTGDNNQVGDNNVHGDGNVVGDNNQVVSGDHNTTGFGDGDVSSTTVGGNVTVGAGGAFGSGSGDVHVDNTDNSQHDVGNTDISLHNVGNTDSSVHDSHNDSSDHSIDHSFDHDSGDVDAHVGDEGISHADHVAVVEPEIDHAVI